jgi:hypothetical protein
MCTSNTGRCAHGILKAKLVLELHAAQKDLALIHDATRDIECISTLAGQRSEWIKNLLGQAEQAGLTLDLCRRACPVEDAQLIGA